jgi:hypothetical protein
MSCTATEEGVMTDMQLQITFDCADPDRLVRFWAVALGYEPPPLPPGCANRADWYRQLGVPEDEIEGIGDDEDRLVDPAGVGPSIWFQQVPEPKTVKNRLHLDLKISGGRDVPLETRRERVLAKVDELIAAGATQTTVLYSEGIDHFGVVLADPEGNEFCVA